MRLFHLLLLTGRGVEALSGPSLAASRRALLRTTGAVAITPGLRRLIPPFLADAFSPSASAASVPSSREKVVNGMRWRSLGSSGILVSELGLGTQRWGSTDGNAPDEAACHRMLDSATSKGVNFIDTAEQYPIPSGRQNPEGYTEQIIGSWLAKDKSRRAKLVIASKITGGISYLSIYLSIYICIYLYLSIYLYVYLNRDLNRDMYPYLHRSQRDAAQHRGRPAGHAQAPRHGLPGHLPAALAGTLHATGKG